MLFCWGGGDFWGFASDDSRLSSWQSRGLACVTQSNCRRLEETLSGTLMNRKANCRPDKDKLSFSFLTRSSCRAKFTSSSLILGQSECTRTEVWWVSGLSVLSCADTLLSQVYLSSQASTSFPLHVSFMSSAPFSFSIMWCFVQYKFERDHYWNYHILCLINSYIKLFSVPYFVHAARDNIKSYLYVISWCYIQPEWSYLWKPFVCIYTQYSHDLVKWRTLPISLW